MTVSGVGTQQHLLDVLDRAATDRVVALSITGERPFLDALVVLKDGRQSLRPRYLDDQPRLTGHHRVGHVGDRVDFSGLQPAEGGWQLLDRGDRPLDELHLSEFVTTRARRVFGVISFRSSRRFAVRSENCP